jgi:hypothetical protein
MPNEHVPRLMSATLPSRDSVKSACETVNLHSAYGSQILYLFTTKIWDDNKRSCCIPCWCKCCRESLNGLVVGCQCRVDANTELHTLQRHIVVVCVELALDVCNSRFVTWAANDAVLAWRGVCDLLKLLCSCEEVVNVEGVDESLLLLWSKNMFPACGDVNDLPT